MLTLLQNLVEILTSTGGLTLLALFFGVSLFIVACELVASPHLESDNPIHPNPDTDPDNSDSDGW